MSFWPPQEGTKKFEIKCAFLLTQTVLGAKFRQMIPKVAILHHQQKVTLKCNMPDYQALMGYITLNWWTVSFHYQTNIMGESDFSPMNSALHTRASEFLVMLNPPRHTAGKFCMKIKVLQKFGVQ